MSLEDHVFILKGPIIRPKDPIQFHRACEESLLRLSRINIRSSDSFFLDEDQVAVTAQGVNDQCFTHKRSLSQAFGHEDISVMLPNSQRLRSAPETNSQGLGVSRSRPHLHTGCSGPSRRPPRVGARYSRMLRVLVDHPDEPLLDPEIPIGDPEILREKQAAVDATEKRSVRDITYQPQKDNRGVIEDVVYLFVLTLTRKQKRSDLHLWGGKQYQLAVDTADSGFWIYGEDFRRLAKVGKGVKATYSVQDWPAKFKPIERKVIPQGDPLAVKAEARVGYGDYGAVHVIRWDDSHDLQFNAPTWDWTTNRVAQTISCLLFPRILADMANDKIAEQMSDGNMGLAVPGWRHPWKDVTSADRVTFHDILRNGQNHVETPMQATLRLLYPDEDLESYADENVRSFLYYGKGSPCGMVVNGTVLLPDYSPPLYIFPDRRVPTEFHFWSMQLLSMTLLEPEPLAADLNHEYVDPAQWVAKRINMPDIQASPDEQPLRGIRVIFDSCAACTILPENVVHGIWRDWFGQQAEEFQPDEDDDSRIWHEDATKFARHDILFEFMDFRGTVFTLRCSAQDFLTSPWHAEGPNTRYAQFECAEDGDGHFILGMNFFWAALLRLDGTHRGSRPVPGRAHPYVQLAPQRIIRGGRRVGTAWDLGLHKYLAPRQLAELRNQPEIHADPWLSS